MQMEGQKLEEQVFGKDFQITNKREANNLKARVNCINVQCVDAST